MQFERHRSLGIWDHCLIQTATIEFTCSKRKAAPTPLRKRPLGVKEVLWNSPVVTIQRKCTLWRCRCAALKVVNTSLVDNHESQWPWKDKEKRWARYKFKGSTLLSSYTVTLPKLRGPNYFYKSLQKGTSYLSGSWLVTSRMQHSMQSFRTEGSICFPHLRGSWSNSFKRNLKDGKADLHLGFFFFFFLLEKQANIRVQPKTRWEEHSHRLQIHIHVHPKIIIASLYSQRWQYIKLAIKWLFFFVKARWVPTLLLLSDSNLCP